MKEKKITNLLKLGALFFGISLLLWNCENESELIPEEITTQLDKHLDFKVKSLTYKQASSEAIFSNLKTKFNIEEPVLYLKKGKYISKVKKNHSKNSKDFSNLGVSIDMSSLKKITTENQTSYTMRIVAYENSSNSFSNIVIQETNGAQEVFTIKYTPSQAQSKSTLSDDSFNGSFAIQNGIVPFDAWNDYEDEDNTGGRDFEEVCDIIDVVTVVPCACSHGAGNYCPSCGGPGTYHYTIIQEEVCYTEYVGSGGDTGDLNGGGTRNPNGSGSLITTPVRSILVDDALETITECLKPNETQVAWINEQNASVTKQINLVGIWNLITATNCSEEAKDFIDLGIEAEIDGAEINWEDRIINELTGKEKCAYNKLKELSLFKSTIKKFEDRDDYNLILKSWTKDACNSDSDDACTDARDLANGNITIYIQNPLQGTLDIAAVILHEGIHAEIYKYVDEYVRGLDPNNRPNILSYYFQYKAQNDNTLLTSNAQHQHMADKYVKPIAQSLRQLDNNKYPLNDYMGLAWDGLRRYGWDGYFDNGNWVTLDRSQYAENINRVLDNTEFNKNCN